LFVHNIPNPNDDIIEVFNTNFQLSSVSSAKLNTICFQGYYISIWL
jgi:hypothetical protein